MICRVDTIGLMVDAFVRLFRGEKTLYFYANVPYIYIIKFTVTMLNKPYEYVCGRLNISKYFWNFQHKLLVWYLPPISKNYFISYYLGSNNTWMSTPSNVTKNIYYTIWHVSACLSRAPPRCSALDIRKTHFSSCN